MNKSAMESLVNSDLNPEEMLNRISHCICVQCYLYNLAVDQADEGTQRYYIHKIKGLCLAVNCLDVTIYIHHEKDMGHRKIEYFALMRNAREMVFEEIDFYMAAEEVR